VTPDSVRAALREMAGKKRPASEDRWREVVQADLGVFAAGFDAGRIDAAA
jgi:hypothetical protein